MNNYFKYHLPILLDNYYLINEIIYNLRMVFRHFSMQKFYFIFFKNMMKFQIFPQLLSKNHFIKSLEIEFIMINYLL